MSTGANKSAKSLSSSKRGFASTYFEMNVFNAFKSDLGKLKIWASKGKDPVLLIYMCVLTLRFSKRSGAAHLHVRFNIAFFEKLNLKILKN